MTTYNTLQKIIPPDQALANEALARSLRQVKEIFNADLPTLSAAVGQLESNKDLPLINALTTPVPSDVSNFWEDTFATGTGPGNTLTTTDVVGTAAGVVHNEELPVLTSVVSSLASSGALNSLTANTGNPSSASNGIYTQMSYCLQEAYGNNITGITIPATSYYSGGAFVDFDDAFGNGLIPAAANLIANIAASNPVANTTAYVAMSNMANQLNLNVNNSISAGIKFTNVAGNVVILDQEANSRSASLSLASQLHEIGLDVTAGGAAQFFEQIANTSIQSGQAVIAAMREGRNIAVLNAVGIKLDTQLVDVNPTPVLANNLSDGQYTVAQAQANVVF